METDYREAVEISHGGAIECYKTSPEPKEERLSNAPRVPEWTDFTFLSESNQKFVKDRLPILFEDDPDGKNLKAGSLLVSKEDSQSLPNQTFINDVRHELHGTTNAIERWNIRSGGNFWSQANFIFKPMNRKNDYTVTFELYSPYGGRRDLGIIGKKGERVKRYHFQQILGFSGITALSLTYNGKDGTLTDMSNGESIQFNTAEGGPVYTTKGDSPPSQGKVTYLIGPFLTENTSVQLAIL